MYKKCCYIICSLITTSIIGLVLGNTKVLATTTCVTDQTGLETCTDSETGAKTYKRSATVNATVTVGYNCSFSLNFTSASNSIREFSTTLVSGGSAEVGSDGSVGVVCNDAGGYAVYIVGYSNDTIGNTDLISSAGSTYNIHTNGANSYWKIKLAANSGTYMPTIANDYLSYHTIPSTYTKVVYYNSPTYGALGSTFSTYYQAHASSDQPAGDYVGKVKYVLVAPESSAPINMESAFAAAGKTKYNGYYKMQDMNANICANVTAIDGETQLIDIRDNKVYYVTKLGDGNCWMTQNLYHSINSNYAYDSNNTDIPDDWEDELNDTYAANSHVFNSWDDEPFSRLGYDECWTGSTGSIPCANGNYHYHRGTYYNWTAAIALEDSFDFEGETADQSICPAGWTLPSPANYSNLLDLYDDLTKSPTYFPLVGYVYNTEIAYIGQSTGYWTNKSTDDKEAKDLYIESSQDGGGQYVDNDSRAYAFSVRCIAR